MGAIGSSLPRRPVLALAYGQWKAVSTLRQSQTRRAWFSCSCKLSANPDREVREARFKLPDTPCRTRFAPSPTGYLHLGSLRTALFNYLLARATGGQFILRIEDTDQSRLVADAEEKLYKDLKWSGLSWDEGPDVNGPHGPYRQSERLHLYQKYADKLVAEGKAYRCFCTPEALEEHKRAQNELGKPTLYPGTCKHISPEVSNERVAKREGFAVRFKSSHTPTVIQDIVYGNYRKRDPEDDYIIIKRDGFPTYHFANVVDDKDMEVTHVIRGAEWLISTPKHVEMYHAFGWQPPKFAHLGLLVDKERQKLSKRHQGVNMAWYQDRYILPETLLNFVSLLGWRGRDPNVAKKPGQNGDVMSLQDMVDNFNLKFSKGDIIVSLGKLDFLQKEHIKRLMSELESNPARIDEFRATLLEPFLERLKETASLSDQLGDPIPDPRVLEMPHVLEVFQVLLRSKEHADLSEQDQFLTAFHPLKYLFYSIPDHVLRSTIGQMGVQSVRLFDEPAALVMVMEWLAAELDRISERDWNTDTIGAFLKANKEVISFSTDLEPDSHYSKNTWKFCRWAVLGGQDGFAVALAMDVLGKERTLKRLNAAKVVAQQLEYK